MRSHRPPVPYGLSGLGLGDLTQSIAAAIAQYEGYNTPGSVAQRNNNPGNLRSGVGQTGSSGGFAVFPSPEAGFTALAHQIDLNISRGLTLNQFFGGVPGGYSGYAPSADANNPVAYASFVGNYAGIPTDTPLNQLGSPGSGTTPGTPTTITDATTGLPAGLPIDMPYFDPGMSGGVATMGIGPDTGTVLLVGLGIVAAYMMLS